MAGPSHREIQARRRKPVIRSYAEARFPSRPGRTACGRVQVAMNDCFADDQPASGRSERLAALEKLELPVWVDSSPSRREGSAVEDGSTAPQQHGRRLSFAKLTLVKASAAGMNVGMLALPDVRLAATTDRIRCKALAMRRSSRRASGTHCGLPGVWFCRAWVVPGTGRRT